MNAMFVAGPLTGVSKDPPHLGQIIRAERLTSELSPYRPR